MKRLIIFSAIAACLTFSKVKAQTVNGVRLSEIKSDYVEVSEFKRSLSNKIFIKLEYGQKISDLRNDAVIKDDDRKDLEFNSLLDCVNKMKSYGYELFQVYAIADFDPGVNRLASSTSVIKHYLLKKK